VELRNQIMKKSHALLVAFLSLVLFTGQSSEDVMRNFSTFEKSLADWMRSVEKLRERMGEVERGVQAGGPVMDRLSEISRNLNALRTELSDMTTRLNKMDETLGGGENPMVQFGKTMETLKKGVAELGKKVEDQAVVTSVLEKRYQEYMRPLDPLKKAIADGEEATKKLSTELELQKKVIETLEKSIIEKLTVLDTLLTQQESASKLLARVENLEKQTGVSLPAEVMPKEVAEVSPVEERPKTPEEEGYEAIGGGFYIKNVVPGAFGSSARVTGEIKNLSEADYSIARFTIRVFDLENSPVITQDFAIKGFKKNDIKTFKEIVPGIEPPKISKLAIKFKETY
jgi:chromosome segregation ATPase